MEGKAVGLSIFLLLLLVQLVSSASSGLPQFHPGTPYSAYYESSLKQWRIQEGCKGGVACAVLTDSQAKTGWYVLNLESYSTFSDYDQAYAAGYVEGAITQQLIWYGWLNAFNSSNFTFTAPFLKFITTNDQWVSNEVEQNQKNSTYWAQIALQLTQFDGLIAGYKAVAPVEQMMSYNEWLLYELQYEIYDIQAAVGSPPKKKNPLDNHCSVLIRLSSDGKNMFSSHDTWSTYTAMLRVWKNYQQPFSISKASSQSFSSYPGTLYSGDDYYVTDQNLVIMETTNEIFNMDLYKATTTHTVPYWIRVMVANRLADSGNSWSQTFTEYNSGTYNNQWQIVNFNKFTPGKTPGNGTLYILEQVPGEIVYGDQTAFLIKNWLWVSYNIPFYPFIYNISGYPAMYKKYGNEYSWSECARAQIFRKRAPAVETFQDMKEIMRYNEYQIDPLSLKDACRGISARCDLNPPWNHDTLNNYSTFGGIDSKITSNKLSSTSTSEIVCGPTWRSQPVFAWTDQWPSAQNPHYGHPSVFNFDWITVAPQQP